MNDLAYLKRAAEELTGMHQDMQALERDLARTERRRLRMPQWQYNVVRFHGQALADRIFNKAPAHVGWLFSLEVRTL